MSPDHLFALTVTTITIRMPVLPTDITVRTGLWVETLSTRVRGITDTDIRIMAADFTVAGLLVARMKDTGSWAAVSKDVGKPEASTVAAASTAAARMVEADPTAAGAAADIVNALAR